MPPKWKRPSRIDANQMDVKILPQKIADQEWEHRFQFYGGEKARPQPGACRSGGSPGKLVCFSEGNR